MKKISSDNIRGEIRKIWPFVSFIWLADEIYLSPSFDEVNDFLAQSTLDKQEFIEHSKDCDDFALQLHAEAKNYFLEKDDLKYPLAFGECFATKWFGKVLKHNGNISICEDGIYLIEPQADLIRHGNATDDNILIVKM